MPVHYYPLINKILKRLQLQDSMLSSFLSQNESSFKKPFITIAREPGSGGAPIAKDVAERLGYEFIDEEIVEEISKSTKKRKMAISAMDEKSRTRIEDMVRSLVSSDYVSDIRYAKAMARVILAYAAKGNCVILGRGGNFITPFAKGLHVYVTAPYNLRVKRAMDFEGHSEKKAKKVIADVEKERQSFVKQYLDHDLNKKNSYDLVLNTSYYQVDEAAKVILEAYYQKFSRSVRYGSKLA